MTDWDDPDTLARNRQPCCSAAIEAQASLTKELAEEREAFGLFKREVSLENVPERVEKFVNMYINGPASFARDDRAIADAFAGPDRAGLIRMVFEDGKLVEAHVENIS